MSSINATGQRVVDIYVGGAGGNPPAAGPCNVVYSLTNVLVPKLHKVAFLSEQNYGKVTMGILVSDILTDGDWLTLATNPNLPPPAGPLEPILVDGIDLNRSVLDCTVARCLQLLGNLQAMPVIYTLFNGKIKKVAFLHGEDKAQPMLGFNITDQVSEASWLSQITISQRVDDIDLTGIIG